MKKTIYTLAMLSGLIFIGCNSPSEKVEDAKDKVEEANEDLKAANLAYEKEYIDYKNETYVKIAANEQSALDFKTRIEHEKKDAKADYNKKIEALEQKNSDMKKKLEDYKAEGKDHWESFKTEFNHDMDELGKAFKDLTVKSVK